MSEQQNSKEQKRNSSTELPKNDVCVNSEILKGSKQRKPQFGTRFLKDENVVYQYNAWDNVEWSEEQLNAARKIILSQSECKMSNTDFKKMEKNAKQHWNEFYGVHQNGFYKDRQWLFTEFPELSFESYSSSSSNSIHCDTRIILEVGCGVGNSVFPILQRNPDPNIHVYCCDFSETAIHILKNDIAYESNRCTAFTYDLTEDTKSLPLQLNSIDIILMVYVLSSIPPNKMKSVLSKLFQYLKPGGLLLFRDYGRYDLAQLRFKNNHYISDNFYARGEGTLVYFFDENELKQMFLNCGYEVIQNISDRRLQVNRKKQLKMYRVWIQGKYVKPHGKIDNK
ncbi:hypothetical protein PGB90_006419 [Kerria lacca]